MGILSWIIFGLIAGVIAKAIHPGKDPGGWIVTIIIGIAGSFVGGWVGSTVMSEPTDQWSLKGFLFAVVGAIILLWLYRLLTNKRK